MADRATWDKRYSGKELVWSAGPNRLFAELIAGLTPARAVDLGCGEGRNSVYLAELGWDVLGVDFSARGIEKARAMATRRKVSPNFMVQDLAELDLPANSRELVAVIFVHHPPELRRHWLSVAVNAVAPGGSFVYIGHDPRNIDEGVGGPQDPAVLASASEIVSFLDGFEIQEARVFERALDADPGHGASGPGTALDTLVFATRPA